MASSTIVLPQGSSYVTAALVSFAFVLQWQSISVGRHRKAAKIPYPQPYAEKAQVEASKEALIFNCAQRAHSNTLENAPIVVLCTLVTALRYPNYAASLCGLYALARIPFTLGYLSGDPSKRLSRGGILGSPAAIALLLGSIYTTGSMIYEGI